MCQAEAATIGKFRSEVVVKQVQMYVGLGKICSWGGVGQFISTTPRKIKFLHQNFVFTFV